MYMPALKSRNRKDDAFERVHQAGVAVLLQRSRGGVWSAKSAQPPAGGLLRLSESARERPCFGR